MWYKFLKHVFQTDFVKCNCVAVKNSFITYEEKLTYFVLYDFT